MEDYIDNQKRSVLNLGILTGLVVTNNIMVRINF